MHTLFFVISDNHVYWANFYIEPNLFHVIDTIIIMEPKLDYINLGKNLFCQTTCQTWSALQVITHIKSGIFKPGEATVATSYMLMMYLERMSEPWLSFARSTMNFLNDQRIMMFAFQATMVLTNYGNTKTKNMTAFWNSLLAEH